MSIYLNPGLLRFGCVNDDLIFVGLTFGLMKLKLNTHDWNYDKPYEWKWGLETLTGKTFVKNKLF